MLPTRASFDALSHRDAEAAALAPRQVKFLVSDLRSPSRVLRFMDTRRYPTHFRFAKNALGRAKSLTSFRREAYFSRRRRWLPGSVVAHDRWVDSKSGERGLYTLEFWPADAVDVELVALGLRLVRKALPFAKGKLRYHPSGVSQVQLYKAQEQRFVALKIPVILTRGLTGGRTYSPLNLGESIGRLRVLSGAQTPKRPPTARDIVVYTVAPNELPHVAGVITECPQTPLSHINLKARQNKTPNAYLKAASQDPRIKRLAGKLVRLRVGRSGLELKAVGSAAAEAHWKRLRPRKGQRPKRQLKVVSIRPLSELRWSDRHAYGSKAAGVAELGRVGDAVRAPEGVALPFSLYHRFMQHGRLYQAAQDMLASPGFAKDPALRKAKLKALRKQIRASPLPAGLETRIARAHARFAAGRALRCRSSSNNEDLPRFNGAGLYGSRTHRKGEGPLSKTVRQVWATLWSFRAFEERSFYRIDHFQTAMGVLIHPNFDKELANGVVISKNLAFPAFKGFTVNVQRGEQNSITNPTHALPEEFVVARLGRLKRGGSRTEELIYLRASSLVPVGTRVLSRKQITALRRGVQAAHRRFARLLRRRDEGFALDLEFKIDAKGRLVFKQARPWVQ